MKNPTAGSIEAQIAQRVQQFSFSLQLFHRNYTELSTFLRYLETPIVAAGVISLEDRWLRQEAMREVQFLLHNYVAAAKSLVDHSRVLYRELYETRKLIPDYQTQVDARFKTHPLSQFIIKLREMAQHYRLPSIRENRSFRTGPLDESLRVRLLLRVEDLRAFESWTAPAETYLNQAGESIHILQLVEDYHSHVLTFYDWFRTEQADALRSSPGVLAHLNQYEIPINSPAIIAAIERNITQLERQPRDSLTLVNLHDALSPGLTILDARHLLLYEHDAKGWVETALAAVSRRAALPSELCARIARMTSPPV